MREQFDCSDCQTHNCNIRSSSYPPFCLTTAADKEQLEQIKSTYKEDPIIAKMFSVSAEIEGMYYGRLTRAEEIIMFAKKMGVEKLGIATCMGTMAETVIFTKILKAKSFDNYLCVCCKAGSFSKDQVGVPAEHRINPDKFEPACNPILQAEILGNAKTDLNVIIGLCVGHDALFSMHSKAPCVTFAVKDRILQHNPMAAIYGVDSYYSRLLEDC